MSSLRFQALNAVLSRTIPEGKSLSSKLSELYGVNVFDQKK
jgi:glutamine synthetase